MPPRDPTQLPPGDAADAVRVPPQSDFNDDAEPDETVYDEDDDDSQLRDDGDDD